MAFICVKFYQYIGYLENKSLLSYAAQPNDDVFP